MEDLKKILDEIDNHFHKELSCKARNKAIGRGYITYSLTNGKGKKENKQIWITNRTYKITSKAACDITGAIKSMTASNVVDTYLRNCTVTSKNTQWGRILLEHYSGNFTCNVPKGKIEYTIHNSSSYLPLGNEITDLKIGISGRKRFIYFKKLSSAYKQLEQSLVDLEKQKEQEAESRKRAAELKEELNRKKKEHEEALKKAADEQQKRLLEEKQKREEQERLEKIRIEEERQAKIEEERKSYEERIDSLSEKYKNALKYIRIQASLKLNPVLDKNQNEAKFSHIYDGNTVIIDGGPGTGKTTTLIQRIKYLTDKDDLEDFRLNNENCKITDNELAIVSGGKNNWLFFSPSELLKTYLEDNMRYEGLYDTDNVFVWKDFVRVALTNNYQIVGDDKPFIYKAKKFENTILIREKELDVVKDFSRYYVKSLKKRILAVSSIDCSKFNWNVLGNMIKSVCATAENVTDIQSLCKMLIRLSEFTDQKMPDNILGVNDINKEYKEKIKRISTLYLSQWSKNQELYDKLLDLMASWIDKDNYDEDEDSDFEEEIPTKNLELKLLGYTKTLFKKIALSKVDNNVKLKGRILELYNLVNFSEQDLNSEELNKLGELVFFVQYFNPVIGNYESTLFSRIPQLYKSYRRDVLKGQYQEWNIPLLKDIVEKNKNRLLHQQEQSLLIGFINNIILSIYKLSPLKFSNLNHKFAVAYNELCRPVIAIDEATDYSIMDYYAISSLRHYKISSFSLTGDVMQCFMTNGITDWNFLTNDKIFPNIDIKELNVSYRQSPELLNLAKSLYKHSMGVDAPYSCYMSEEQNTPKPLWYESDDEEEKVDWIASRIIEVKKAYNVLPFIAIFVKDKVEANELKELLEDSGRLETNGIKVQDCSSGDIKINKTFVRIFPLDLVKGMEFEVVFFHNIDMISSPLIDKYLYVGLSRATFYMGVTSSTEKSDELLELEKYFSNTGNWMDIK